LAQLRYRDKTRGSYQRGFDEPTCIWCGADNHPKSHEVLSPKKFCTSKCRTKFKDEQMRNRTALGRRCGCGAPPTNGFGIPYCEPCRVRRKRERSRARSLRPYGIVVADYERILAEQFGRCAICRSTDPGHGHDVFAVDHCHATNQVRGLLCRNCNSAIGLLQDSPRVIRAAAAYVERTRQLRLAI
jgi:hypothetical protein